MKDSWSHGDGRRDRGRVDRGVNRPRRSPSPAVRRSESDREAKARGRSAEKSRSSRPKHRHRDLSDDRRRPVSRSPVSDSREEVRERNRGRELLDTRISGKPRRSDHHEHHSDKRRRSRSPSRDRTERKRSRRANSRSPARGEDSSTSARLTRRERSPHRQHTRRFIKPQQYVQQIKARIVEPQTSQKDVVILLYLAVIGLHRVHGHRLQGAVRTIENEVEVLKQVLIKERQVATDHHIHILRKRAGAEVILRILEDDH